MRPHPFFGVIHVPPFLGHPHSPHIIALRASWASSSIACNWATIHHHNQIVIPYQTKTLALRCPQKENRPTVAIRPPPVRRQQFGQNLPLKHQLSISVLADLARQQLFTRQLIASFTTLSDHHPQGHKALRNRRPPHRTTQLLALTESRHWKDKMQR